MTQIKIISPKQFKESFLYVARDNEAEIKKLWDGSRKLYTTFMMDVCRKVATLLGLYYYENYWTLDAIFFEEEDTMHFHTGFYVKYINIALEHENESSQAHNEINKLSIINSPLKILITYTRKSRIDRLLNEFAEIIQEADSFSDFSSYRKQLVILGFKNRSNNLPCWEFYVFKEGNFVAI